MVPHHRTKGQAALALGAELGVLSPPSESHRAGRELHHGPPLTIAARLAMQPCERAGPARRPGEGCYTSRWSGLVTRGLWGAGGAGSGAAPGRGGRPHDLRPPRQGRGGEGRAGRGGGGAATMAHARPAGRAPGRLFRAGPGRAPLRQYLEDCTSSRASPLPRPPHCGQGCGQFFWGLDNWSIGQFSWIILDNAGQ